jgi:hypothetical protein
MCLISQPAIAPNIRVQPALGAYQQMFSGGYACRYKCCFDWQATWQKQLNWPKLAQTGHVWSKTAKLIQTRHDSKGGFVGATTMCLIQEMLQG